MFKFPKIFADKFQNEEYNKVNTGFDKDTIIDIFNGRNSIEYIYSHFLSSGVSFEKINNLFQSLIEHQLLTDKISFESSFLSDDELEVFSDQITTLSCFSQKQEENKYNNLLAGLRSQEKLHQAKIKVSGSAPLAQEILNKCKQAGINDIVAIDDPGSNHVNADLLIYLPNDYNEEELVQLLKVCNKSQVPFFPIVQTNYGIELGPLFVQNDSSCYLCLINRKKSVLGEGYNQYITDKLTFNFNIGSDLIVLEVIKLITGIAPLTLRNKVLQFNIISGIFTHHPVLKVPNCEVCGLGQSKPKRKLWEGIA